MCNILISNWYINSLKVCDPTPITPTYIDSAAPETENKEKKRTKKILKKIKIQGGPKSWQVNMKKYIENVTNLSKI